MCFITDATATIYFIFLRRLMADENGSGAASNFIWAFALIVIVALIVGAMYYGGFLSGKQTKQVDINVSAPSR
jgi:hypothetical protein